MVPASVITHAISPDSYFPLWYQYYGKAVGFKNLYVITNGGASRLFEPFELGGVWEVSSNFDDARRAKVASSLAAALLVQSKVVINVDTDEFAVPHPDKYSSLADYIGKVHVPYVTGMGMNVAQLEGEGPLSFEGPILHRQRKWALPRATLNKTCYITEPVSWTAGFHWCSHFPKFDDLFLFHLKYADDDIRAAHNLKMAELFAGDAGKQKYYSPDPELIGRIKYVTKALKTEAGMAAMVRHDFNTRFLAEVRFHPPTKFYLGKDVHDEVRIEMPEAFAALM